MASLDRFLHHLPAGRPQWALAASGQKPEPLIFGVAVKKNDALACHSVMKSWRWILGDQSEECIPPGLIGIVKDFFGKLLEFFHADGSDGFSDGFAPLFVDALGVDLIEWHSQLFSWICLVIGKVLRAAPRGVAFLPVRPQPVHQALVPSSPVLSAEKTSHTFA